MKEKREKAIKTKKGFVIYKNQKAKNHWQIQFPDSSYNYGDCTTRNLINFLMCIDEGKSLNKAKEIAGLRT